MEIERERLEEAETEEVLSDPEKFGNCPEICQFLETGRILSIVDIDEVRPELIGTHRSQVDLANVEPTAFIHKHINEAFAVEIEANGQIFQGIFKPLKGEEEKLKGKLGISDCYKREEAAYLLDQFLGFGIVPPTVIREINGDIGALRLYVPPEIADSHQLLSGQVDFSQEQGGIDWRLMAAFDYIAANWERKPENWLVNSKKPEELYAIDHGFAFYSQGLGFRKRGPRLNLTHDNISGKPIETPIPPEILEGLQGVLDRQDELKTKLSDLIPPREIDGVIERIGNLVKERKFL